MSTYVEMDKSLVECVRIVLMACGTKAAVVIKAAMSPRIDVILNLIKNVKVIHSFAAESEVPLFVLVRQNPNHCWRKLLPLTN